MKVTANASSAIGLASLLLGLAGAPSCAHRSAANANANASAMVPLGEWCAQVTTKMCELAAKGCFKGLSGDTDSCKKSGIPSCLAGRAATTPSDRTPDELAACLRKLEPLKLEPLSCEAGGKSSEGELVALCSASTLEPMAKSR